MTLNSVDKLYWAVGYAGQIFLLAILLYRRLTKSFPLFTSLIAFNFARTTILVCVESFASGGWYFYTYWTLFGVDIALQFLVMYEIAGVVFRPLGYWAPDIKKRAVPWIVVSIILASLLTLLPKPDVEVWYQTLMLKASFLASVVECELFVGIAVLSWEGGFPWKSYVARIALGFAMFAFPDMVVEIATTRFGLKDSDVIYQHLIHVRMAAYLVSLLFWNVALWRKEPVSREMSIHMSGQLDAINQSVATGFQALEPERKSR
jgi:hypothetical protein